MKTPFIKRSVVIAGHKTSVRLEDAFWSGLKEIGRGRGMKLSELIASSIVGYPLIRPQSLSEWARTRRAQWGARSRSGAFGPDRQMKAEMIVIMGRQGTAVALKQSLAFLDTSEF